LGECQADLLAIATDPLRNPIKHNAAVLDPSGSCPGRRIQNRAYVGSDITGVLVPVEGQDGSGPDLIARTQSTPATEPRTVKKRSAQQNQINATVGGKFTSF
jgi:hypothetical protein